MLDITNLSKEELIELRSRINGRIASLTLQEKKKLDPKKYSYRNMPLYISKNEHGQKLLDKILVDYRDFIKGDVKYQMFETNGKYIGTNWVVNLFAPKEIRDEILKRFTYRRLYRSRTPESKVMYKGYKISDWN